MLVKTYHFSDGCTITLQNNNEVHINTHDESCQFDDNDKPLFNYDTGETVIEYSGLVVDGNEKRSWACATYTPKAHAPLHYHEHLTEDYYIVSGKANVMIDGECHVILAGEHIQIKPSQLHQVINDSEKDDLILIVKCTPSWYKQDYNLVTNTESPCLRIKI